MNPAATGLYVHIPWCIKKCPYCDFNSHAHHGALPELEYLQALERDILYQANLFQGRSITSVFIGGGTPSLFSASGIDKLLGLINRYFSLAAGAEITLEANPGAVEQQRFKDYRSAGINRISLGVQSFSDAALQALGRVHNAGDAMNAIDTVKRSGFERWNIDLMHGLPEQTPADALHDLQLAIDASASHISWYQLTIETNTAFYNSPPQLPDEDVLADIQDAGQELLRTHGLEQYEVSAYAAASQQCQHNLNYWKFGDYAAIGAGAHGKISAQNEGQPLNIQRFWNTRQPDNYINAKQGIAGQRELSVEDSAFEFMLNALRLNDGFDQHLFEQGTGQAIDSVSQTLASLCDRELLKQTDECFAATEMGRRYLNDVVAEFLPAEKP